MKTVVTFFSFVSLTPLFLLETQREVAAPAQPGFSLVTRVVDGDTLVDAEGVQEKVRLIGLDTPEVVDPRRPVECFGREASKKAKESLERNSVRLESVPGRS